MSQNYYGSRDESFKKMLIEALELSELSEPERFDLLDDIALKQYSMAFTTSSINPLNNYEFVEILGDGTVNKIVLWYMTRRFPQINCGEAVDILTKLKIKYVQSNTLSEFSEKLGFWPFISTSIDRINHVYSKQKILEDVFESFIAITEMTFDRQYGQGKGYKYCYRIVSKLLDNLDISVNYDDLISSTTLVKETVDHYQNIKVTYNKYVIETLSPNDEKLRVTAYLEKLEIPSVKTIIGKGVGFGKDAEKICNDNAIKTLRSMGYNKPIPQIYLKYCM
jgi:dsRNA-specific ribonuclease